MAANTGDSADARTAGEPVSRVGPYLLVPALLVASGWLAHRIAPGTHDLRLFWPPAGVGLAALLRWGRPAVPGTWAGALLLSLGLAGAAGGGIPALGPSDLGSAVAAASISTVQAIAAAWLCRGALRAGVPRLDSARSFLLFAALTGPLASLLTPAISLAIGGLGAWLPGGWVPADLARVRPPLLPILASWVGDSLGVVIVAPLMFCLFGAPRALWGARRLTLGVPSVAMLLLVVSAFGFVRRTELDRSQLELERRASAVHIRLADRLEGIRHTSTLLAAAVGSSPALDRGDFHLLASNALDLHPEIQAFEWSPRVPADSLAQIEAVARAEGMPTFTVRERDATDRLVPVTPRERYFPVRFVEPLQGNERALGYDLASEPVRGAALLRALSSAAPQVTERIVLVQEAASGFGTLLFAPVSHVRPTAEAPRPPDGVVVAVLRMNTLVARALQHISLDGLTVALLDTSSPEGAHLLSGEIPPLAALDDAGIKPLSRTIDFGGRAWQIVVVPDPGVLGTYGSWFAWGTLIAGLLMMTTQYAYLLTITGRTAHVEALVEARTGELRASEAMLRTVVDSEPECVALVAANGDIDQINRAGRLMIEAGPLDRVVGRPLAEFVSADDRDALNQLRALVFRGGSGTLQVEVEGLLGGRRWLDVHTVPILDAGGGTSFMLCVGRDVTAQRQAEEQLRLAAGVFSSAQEGIAITDASGRIVDLNPAYTEITGYSREDLIGSRTRVHRSAKHPAEFYDAMDTAIAQEDHWRGELWNLKKNGEPYAERLTVSGLYDAKGAIRHRVHLFSDITLTQNQKDRLEWMAHYDALTQLPNRTLLGGRFAVVAAASARSQTTVAVCFTDLDGFKQVNDTYGHEIGDRLLIAVAGRIAGCLRGADTVSRHGGDEFVLLLGELESKAQCERVMQRIHTALARPYEIDEHEIRITASSGIALCPADATDLDALLRLSDQAMYRAKAEGKDGFRWFDGSGDQDARQHRIQRSALTTALRAGELCLYFQPKVDMKRGTVVGAEALIRWNHPARGVLGPGEFLPIAEGTDLEIEIGNWVIAEAYRHLDEWRVQGLLLPVSVNVSTRHVLSDGFLANLEDLAASLPHVPPSALELELLESSVIGDLTALTRTLRSCQDALGIQVALDDFGTGYSSLAHLRYLAPDVVKIDRSFVRDMGEDPEDHAIVECVVRLAEAFQCEVVAEGVETVEQGLALLAFGCTVAQGFGIARPMSADRLCAWVIGYRAQPEWLSAAPASNVLRAPARLPRPRPAT